MSEQEQIEQEPGEQQVERRRSAMPRPFLLYRRTDPTGVSGTGVVASGALFADGTIAVHWLGEHHSTVIWPGPDALEHVLAVHGHGGATTLLWGIEPN